MNTNRLLIVIKGLILFLTQINIIDSSLAIPDRFDSNLFHRLNFGNTTDKFCINPVDSNQPDCSLSFREDSSWTSKFNATCIRPNVFLLPFNRTNGYYAPTAFGDQRQPFYSEHFLPPYLRIKCKANFPLDFKFDGNAGLEFFRVWKSVSYVNRTDQMESQDINVELLMSPEASGRFVFYSTELPAIETSFYIFAERPAEGPFLVTPGKGLPLIGKIGNDGRYIVPCISTNLDVTIELLVLTQGKWFLRKGFSNETAMGYTPEEGFHLQPFTPDPSDASNILFQCRIGHESQGDLVNVTLPIKSDNTAKKHNLKILVKEGEGGLCTGPESEQPIEFYNVLVRNPTESKLVIDCLLKGLRNCGRSAYHQRIVGTSIFNDDLRNLLYPDEKLHPDCALNDTLVSCSSIASTRLHKEGLLVCIGSTEFATLEYVTGFDNKIYTDAKLAPPSSLLKVDWTEMGIVSSTPNATSLLTGVKYELNCLSVEFLLIKESQLLFVKYRNGTSSLIDELVWWKSGIEMYLSSDMIELECRDRLWLTNEFYNSSTTIKVTDRSCDADQFRCHSGQCVKESWRCDGDKDCLDASDEENCHVHVCKPGFFKCLSGQCVSMDKKCNNKRECPDASDESKETCLDVTCNWEEFKCQTGQCVLAHFLCDGDSDCFDGSDESTANCRKYFPSISTLNQNVTFIEGTTGELICDTQTLPPRLKPRLEWWRQEYNITDPSRLWRNIDGSKLSLRFSNLSTEHSGIFECFAQNMLARSSLKFNITILKNKPSQSPCSINMTQDECLKNICESWPNLTWCLQKETGTNVTSDSVIPIWIIILGIIFLLILGSFVGIYIWKYYYSSNIGFPRNAVRLRDNDEVVILNRSGYD